MTDKPPSRPGWLAPVLAVALTLGLCVAVMEGALRLALNPSDFMQATLVEDPALGLRIAPGTTGHDALGFRNAKAPERSRVVAIGDSHTYGVSAPRDGSWPQQLSVRLGEPVYNMGLGGFGPLQYLHLARTTARSLEPKVVVVGLYFGNDIVDAYYLAHGRAQWHGWRRSAAPVNDAPAAATDEPPKRFGALRDWLSRHSMIYSVTRATVTGALEKRAAPAAPAVPAVTDQRWAWQDPAAPATRTVFRPAVRLQAVDAARPAVAEGLLITERALTELQAEVSGQGARLLVVTIPTKERAYCAYLKSTSATLPPAHARLCDVESSIRARLADVMTRERIEHVDATPALEARIAAHAQLYPPDDDGHEVAAGYGVIAGVVADALSRPAPSR
jgi:lysophospholipase L1-like esterase